MAHVARREPRRRALCRDGPEVDRGEIDRRCQVDALRVVEVDDRGAQIRPGEELRLGLPVGLHVAVVVEVVLREVGEHRDRDARAGEAVLGDADRRGLDARRRRSAGRRNRARRSAGRSGRASSCRSRGCARRHRRPRSSSRGASPMPSVPMTPQRRPSEVSACATHHAVEVLPFVPVTATTSSSALGMFRKRLAMSPAAALKPCRRGDARRIGEGERLDAVGLDQARHLRRRQAPRRRSAGRRLRGRARR